MEHIGEDFPGLGVERTELVPVRDVERVFFDAGQGEFYARNRGDVECFLADFEGGVREMHAHLLVRSLEEIQFEVANGEPKCALRIFELLFCFVARGSGSSFDKMRRFVFLEDSAGLLIHSKYGDLHVLDIHIVNFIHTHNDVYLHFMEVLLEYAESCDAPILLSTSGFKGAFAGPFVGWGTHIYWEWKNALIQGKELDPKSFIEDQLSRWNRLQSGEAVEDVYTPKMVAYRLGVTGYLKGQDEYFWAWYRFCKEFEITDEGRMDVARWIFKTFNGDIELLEGLRPHLQRLLDAHVRYFDADEIWSLSMLGQDIKVLMHSYFQNPEDFDDSLVRRLEHFNAFLDEYFCKFAVSEEKYADIVQTWFDLFSRFSSDGIFGKLTACFEQVNRLRTIIEDQLGSEDAELFDELFPAIMQIVGMCFRDCFKDTENDFFKWLLNQDGAFLEFLAVCFEVLALAHSDLDSDEAFEALISSGYDRFLFVVDAFYRMQYPMSVACCLVVDGMDVAVKLYDDDPRAPREQWEQDCLVAERELDLCLNFLPKDEFAEKHVRMLERFRRLESCYWALNAKEFDTEEERTRAGIYLEKMQVTRERFLNDFSFGLNASQLLLLQSDIESLHSIFENDFAAMVSFCERNKGVFSEEFMRALVFNRLPAAFLKALASRLSPEVKAGLDECSALVRMLLMQDCMQHFAQHEQIEGQVLIGEATLSSDDLIGRFAAHVNGYFFEAKEALISKRTVRFGWLPTGLKFHVYEPFAVSQLNALVNAVETLGAERETGALYSQGFKLDLGNTCFCTPPVWTIGEVKQLVSFFVYFGIFSDRNAVCREFDLQLCGTGPWGERDSRIAGLVFRTCSGEAKVFDPDAFEFSKLTAAHLATNRDDVTRGRLLVEDAGVRRLTPCDMGDVSDHCGERRTDLLAVVGMETVYYFFVLGQLLAHRSCDWDAGLLEIASDTFDRLEKVFSEVDDLMEMAKQTVWVSRAVGEVPAIKGKDDPENHAHVLNEVLRIAAGDSELKDRVVNIVLDAEEFVETWCEGLVEEYPEKHAAFLDGLLD